MTLAHFRFSHKSEVTPGLGRRLLCTAILTHLGACEGAVVGLS